LILLALMTIGLSSGDDAYGVAATGIDNGENVVRYRSDRSNADLTIIEAIIDNFEAPAIKQHVGGEVETEASALLVGRAFDDIEFNFHENIIRLTRSFAIILSALGVYVVDHTDFRRLTKCSLGGYGLATEDLDQRHCLPWGTVMKAILTGLALVVLLAISAKAENPSPYSGMVSVETGKPFAKFVKAVGPAIKKHKFNIVGVACGSCAAKSQGKTVPGNRVFFFFAPRYAVRMLSASTAAGIEAPVRFYVTENSGRTATVTYRLPSHVFGAYEVPELTVMGKELDKMMTTILASAIAGA